MFFWRREKPRRRVGILGGSFNPPHVGHSAICRWCLGQSFVDELWVIPCLEHPFGKEIAPFEHRFAMCRLAFEKLGPRVSVLDIERKLGGVSYTIRTIRELRARHPDFRFSLVTGDDVREQTDLWKDFADIRTLAEILRVPRGLRSPIPNVSSTDIRYRIDLREAYRDLVEPEVAVYIITKGLYR